MNTKELTKNLFGGSIILLITINIFNALNYFFHFAMARMLIPADYGVLAALMSILYIFNVPTEAIQTIIAKYSSQESSLGKIKNIIKKSFRKAAKVSFMLILVYLAACLVLTKILDINYSLLALTGLLIFSVFFLPISRGVLQGKKKFKSLGFNMVIEASVKILLAILFVYIGMKVYGAILGVFIGTVCAFVLAFPSLKEVFSSKELKSNTSGIYNYSIPVFVTIFAIIIFYSLDVILAKAFFSADLAGQYAMASTLAKIIFFGTVPLSKAMFPISSESHKDKKSSLKILGISLLILTACIAIALTIIWFFPELLVRIFSGNYHPAASGILFYLAISMSLISFTNLILLYKLSINKVKDYAILLIFPLIEIALLSFFHSNLVEYSVTLIFLNLLFLFGSIFLFND